MDNHELSNEQILELLNNVEGKLKTQDRCESTSERHSLRDSTTGISIAGTKAVEPYINNTSKTPHVLSSKVITSHERKLAQEFRTVTDPVLTKHKLAEEKKLTAGSSWYNLPRTKLTPEVKRDFKLLRMRDVLDPKRHYKKDKSRDEFPEFSQVGTIIEGPTEYYSGRLFNKERKQTLLEETLHSTKSMQRFKRKYAEIQAVKTSGKRAHYKKLREMRTKKRFLK